MNRVIDCNIILDIYFRFKKVAVVLKHSFKPEILSGVKIFTDFNLVVHINHVISRLFQWPLREVIIMYLDRNNEAVIMKK